MRDENFADIEYSKQLADLFPNAEYFWVPYYTWNFKTKEHDSKSWKIEEKSRFTSQPKFTNQGGTWYTDKDKELRRTLLQRWEDRIPALTTDILLERFKLIRISKIELLGYECWCPKAKNIDDDYLHFSDIKLSNVLCKMLLWLQSNGLVEGELTK